MLVCIIVFPIITAGCPSTVGTFNSAGGIIDGFAVFTSLGWSIIVYIE